MENGKDEKATPLTPSLRKEYQKLIQRRQDTILKSLETELVGDAASIGSKIRSEEGFNMSAEQLQDLIETIEEQISAIVQKNLPEAKRDIEIEISNVEDKYDEQIQELKTEMRTKVAELEASKVEEKRVLRQKMKEAEALIANDFAKDLVEKISSYKDQLVRTQAFEIEIKGHVLQRMAIIKHSKGRLKALILDTGGRALEKLMATKTEEEAILLVQSIPTVSDALEMIKTQEGLQRLFASLDPNAKLIPPPLHTENVVRVVDSTEEDNSEELEEEIDGIVDEVFDENRRYNNRRRW